MVDTRRVLRWLPRLLPIGVSAALVVLIALHFEDLELLRNVRVELLLAGMAVALGLDVLLGGLKWCFVLRAAGIVLPVRRSLFLWNGLLAASFFPPFQTGHLLYAVVVRNETGLGWYRSVEAVGYDKYLNLVATFVLIALGQLVVPPGHPLSQGVFTALGVLVFLGYLADGLLFRFLGRFPFVRERSGFLRRPMGLRRKLPALVLAVVYQSSDAISMWFACAALGLAVDPALVFGAYPLILLLSYVPISVNGIGVRENLVPALLLGGTFTYDQGVAAGALVTFLEYMWPALFGVLTLRPVLRLLHLAPPPEESST